MPLAMWAKTAVGTNLPFFKSFGKAVKSWRDILHQTIQGKVAPRPAKYQHINDLGAKQKCLIQTPVAARPGLTLQSRIFRSLMPRTISRSLVGELRRRYALRPWSGSAGGYRHVPIMSLVGLTLGLDVSTVLDDGAEKIMAEMRNKFQGYTWQTEPLAMRPQSLADLDINLQSIDSGCEGAVYKAKVKVDNGTSTTSCDKGDGYDLAVKVVFNYGAESNSQSILKSLEREIVPLRTEGCQDDSLEKKHIARLPPHPNIVEMPGMFIDDMLVTEEGLRKFPAALPNRLNPDLHYGRNKTLYLVMRRRSTHLRAYLADNEIPMETRCMMLAQLLEGVAHMGVHGIAHRDLKSDNVLVDVSEAGGTPRLEICDFGCCLAEENRSLKIPYPTRHMDIGGNSWLMAPEVVTAVPGHGSVLDFSKSDLWAAGTIAYEILGAENPFYPSQGNTRQQLNSRYYRVEDLPPLPDNVPSAVKRLVKAILARDPNQRPSPCVAATVVQLVVLEASAFRSPPDSAKDNIFRKTSTTSQSSHCRRSVQISDALHNERRKFTWVIIQSLAMLCQLIFGNQSESWDMKSVMNFLLLSRLTYADFREALKFL